MDKLKYKLVIRCIHGGNLHGGHYFAMCKDHKVNKWILAKGKNIVTDTNIDDVLKQTPYCLFYVKS